MKLGIIGFGNIGSTIFDLLKDHNKISKISVADSRLLDQENFFQFDFRDNNLLENFIRNQDFIIGSTPFSVNKNISKICKDYNVSYFDLTEDVKTTKFIKKLSIDSNCSFMPQCGLAPGAVNIIAAGLVKKFKKVKNVEIRVGAIPTNASNLMKYYLSWSTEGLINEYCNPGEAIENKKIISTVSLEGNETLIFDGSMYECFNTSGGIGTMVESFQGKVENLNYKTIRYPGHSNYMKFLINDLNFKNNRSLLTKIFNKEIPKVIDDVVIIYIKVDGYDSDQNIKQEVYFKKIYNNEKYSAIKLTTANGVCSVIDLFLNNKIPNKGFIKQEDIDLSDFLNNQYGKIYKN